MKLLDFLKFGQRVKPLPPIRTIQEPGRARKERIGAQVQAEQQAKAAAKPAPPGPNRPREIDPVFEDTGSLELTKEEQDDVNPYDTQSWETGPREGLRRVDIRKGINREKTEKQKDVANPYDTGIVRKGW